MHSIKHFYFLFTCFLMSILLSACGSKGDLYQAVDPELKQSVTEIEPKQKNIDTKKKSK